MNLKEPVELEPMTKIDEIRRFSNKELRLTKESMGSPVNIADRSGRNCTVTYPGLKGWQTTLSLKKTYALFLRLRASSVTKNLDVQNCDDKERC